ncbi:MAG: glycosyltransferase family 4 protein [Planctomycetota bacterium]
MLIRSYWPGPEGGAECQCRKLVAQLDRLGVTCTIVTYWPAWNVPRRERKGNVLICRVGVLRPAIRRVLDWRNRIRGPTAGIQAVAEGAGSARRFRPLGPLRWLSRLSFMIEAAAVVRRGHFDVIHVHESHWLAGFGAWLADRLGIPVVCKESTWPALPPSEVDVPFGRIWERWRTRPWFIATGPHIRDSLAEQGVPADRICVVPTGVEIPAGTSALEGNRVLYVGNLWQGARWKAFDVLMEAWGRVHAAEPGARLAVVGGGDPRPWQDKARELGCGESVMFAGTVDDVSVFYRQAGLFVLPSRREGLSNALLEAQSWGIPAVVSDIPGNRAVVRDGENGILVPVNDSGALAAAILRLLRDAGLQARMGRAARLRMERDFAMEEVARQIAAVYQQVIGTSRAGRCA